MGPLIQTHAATRRVTLAFIAVGALMIALAGVAWAVTQASLKAAAFVAHTHAVVGALGEAEAQLMLAEASQRALLVGLDLRFARQREAAIATLERSLVELDTLTQDNPLQQRRLDTLQKLIDQRIASLREIEAALRAGRPMSAAQRLEEGLDFRDRVHPNFSAMVAEERSLLARREAEDARLASTVELLFGALALGMATLLPLGIWRVRTDVAARHAAEAEAANERRYDALHTRALTLFNVGSDARSMLDGTLELLADGGLFPVSALYLHDELSGSLRLEARHGTLDDVAPVVRLGVGPVGEAARQRRAVYLDAFDPEGHGLVIETGLARVRPAALLACPIDHQAKVLGVLVLACAGRLSERERSFIDRLAAQLGVALNNQAQLAGLNQLAHALQERTAEVEQKNVELEHATRMKTDFLANMSHELRAPLNAIIGFSDILRDGLSGPLSEEQTEFIGHIRSSGRHLLALINDILDLSKVEAGQMSLNLGPENPAEVAAESLQVVRQRAGQRGIQVLDQSDAALGRVVVDGRKVKQILNNLLSNAVKFSAAGGVVTLRLRRVGADALSAALGPAGTVPGVRVFEPAAAAHPRWLEIEVRDSGIGIAPSGLESLFQPFVQIDSSLTREYEGSGLGLTMVQRLTQLHGSGLRVESELGRGSVFTVWLPWRELGEPLQAAGAAEPPAEAAAAPALPGPPRAAAAAQPPLVLMIDDDVGCVALMRKQLQGAGYRVVSALDPQEGLELAEQLLPQVILVDVLMPGMDGWEMLARLKERESTRHVPVVIASITDEPRRGFALGAAQVLVKPVAKDDLLAALAASGLRPMAPGSRVLVVDDDPNAVTIVTRQLEADGYEVISAYGGQEALEQVRHHRPALIVLDLMMPHVSGFDVVEALGEDPGTVDIPIIVLTAKLVTAADRELLRGRVQRLIEKSAFESHGLLAEIRRAMAQPPRHAPRNAERVH